MKHLGSDHLPKGEVVSYLQRKGTSEWLRRWKLHGTPKNIKKNRNCRQLIAAYKVSIPCWGIQLKVSSPAELGKTFFL